MLYIVTKRMEVAGSHRLALPYPSKCSNLHGHNWIVEVTMSCQELDEAGMVMDFGHIKKVIMRYDHQNLSDITMLNPTAENMARLFCEDIDMYIDDEIADSGVRSLRVSKISVQESEGNTACYIP